MNDMQGIFKRLREVRGLLVECEQEIQRLKEENALLKCENKRIINVIKTQPCTRFCDAPAMAWIAKLIEETHEVVQEAHIISQLTDEEMLKKLLQNAQMRLALELTDVITLCTSWLDALGYDEEARGKLQERVNEKNHKRGDWE
ncbi:hypothetical protein QCO44_09340 [Selenomonas sputigena]|uniref:FlgN protein n=1 Tax=Selenomonas sputigena TaxID=69823 RepID=A0ABV3X6V9_9FIRM